MDEFPKDFCAKVTSDPEVWHSSCQMPGSTLNACAASVHRYFWMFYVFSTWPLLLLFLLLLLLRQDGSNEGLGRTGAEVLGPPSPLWESELVVGDVQEYLQLLFHLRRLLPLLLLLLRFLVERHLEEEGHRGAVDGIVRRCRAREGALPAECRTGEGPSPAP